MIEPRDLFYKGLVPLLLLTIWVVYRVQTQGLPAECLEVPSSWSVTRSKADLRQIFLLDKVTAAGGIRVVSSADEKYVYLTHGYSETHMSKFSINLEWLRSAGHRKGSISQPLLAGLAESGEVIAWTRFRSTQLLLTDLNLEFIANIELGSNYRGAVGIVEIAPMTFAVLSSSKDELAVVEVADIAAPRVTTVNLLRAGYGAHDIASNGTCFAIVYRSSGEIKQGSVSDLYTKKRIRLLPFSEQLEKPQHAEFLQNKLYVIESGTRKISVFNPSSQVKSEYSLPIALYRGLTVKGENTVLLTGFVRDQYIEEGLMDEIDADRTGIFEYSLAQ